MDKVELYKQVFTSFKRLCAIYDGVSMLARLIWVAAFSALVYAFADDSEIHLFGFDGIARYKLTQKLR